MGAALMQAQNWSAQRAKEAVPRLFGVIGLARDTLHREAPELAHASNADHPLDAVLPGQDVALAQRGRRRRFAVVRAAVVRAQRGGDALGRRGDMGRIRRAPVGPDRFGIGRRHEP